MRATIGHERYAITTLATRTKHNGTIDEEGYLRVALFLGCSILMIERFKRGNLLGYALNAVRVDYLAVIDQRGGSR